MPFPPHVLRIQFCMTPSKMDLCVHRVCICVYVYFYKLFSLLLFFACNAKKGQGHQYVAESAKANRTLTCSLSLLLFLHN